MDTADAMRLIVPCLLGIAWLTVGNSADRRARRSGEPSARSHKTCAAAAGSGCVRSDGGGGGGS